MSAERHTSRSRESLSAFVLAAGFGTRLRPLTTLYPKPLIPLLGKPLIESVLTKLCDVGAAEIGVNGHHLAEKIEAYLRDSPFSTRAVFFHEPVILGTGGALANAKRFIGKSDLCLLHNGDVLSDVDIGGLMAHHLCSGNILTLVLTPGPENRVLVDTDGRIIDICGRLGRPAIPQTTLLLTYTGIALMSRRFVEFVPDDIAFHNLIDIYLAAVKQQPAAVGAFIPGKMYWNDLGTVGQYLQAHEDILVKRLYAPPGVDIPNGPVYMGEGARISPTATVEGFAAFGHECVVGEGAFVKNCVVVDRSVIPTGGYYSGLVVGAGFLIHRDNDFLKTLAILKRTDLSRSNVFSLVEQGSDRRFYRIEKGGRSKALMISHEGDPDFPRFVEIGTYLRACKLGPPRIHTIDEARCSLLMEDLGDGLLHRRLTAATTPAEVEKLYRKVIDYLVRLQRDGTRDVKECPAAASRALDYEVLRWETTYFKDNFLQRVAGLDDDGTASLEAEFHLLATLTGRQPYVLIHRDFQSQNILIKNGKTRIVDFQGARMGPLCYDLASLLNDSYFEIPEDMKARLLDYYFMRLSRAGFIPCTRSEFDSYFILAGLQRNAQALGAFGFLSLIKGKMHYQKFIPLGLKHLRNGLRKAATLPELAGAFPNLERIVFDRIPERLAG